MAFGRGARSSLINSVHARSQLVIVFRLKSVDAASAVKLSAKHFICLAEAIQFCGQVRVLALQAGGVLLESLFLGKKISSIVSILVRLDTQAVNISPACEERVFLFFETHFGVTDLNRDIGVTSFLEINFLAQVVILSTNAFVVPSQTSIGLRKVSVRVSHSGELSLSVLESELLCSQILAAGINELLGILDTSLGAVVFEVQVLQFFSLVSGFL